MTFQSNIEEGLEPIVFHYKSLCVIVMFLLSTHITLIQTLKKKKKQYWQQKARWVGIVVYVTPSTNLEDTGWFSKPEVISCPCHPSHHSLQTFFILLLN